MIGRAIRNFAGRPFSITCWFNGLHAPNVIPSPYHEQFDPARLELPANHNATEPYFEQNWSGTIGGASPAAAEVVNSFCSAFWP